MQRKVIASLMSFNKNWAEYRDGFGSAAGNENYWLGLDKVYRLVQMGSAALRVEVCSNLLSRLPAHSLLCFLVKNDEELSVDCIWPTQENNVERN